MSDAYRAPMVSGRALDEGVVGVRAVENARDEARLGRFCAVPDGSFAWTRLDGTFHLGRLAGPYVERTDPADVRDELVHVRPCEWHEVHVALVPEQVRYAFSRGGRNFQRIGLAGAAAATAAVWDELTGPG